MAYPQKPAEFRNRVQRICPAIAILPKSPNPHCGDMDSLAAGHALHC